MTERKEEIKQENRKALPKFLLYLLIGACVGGVIGFCCSYFGLDAMADGFHHIGLAFSQKIAPWLLVLCVLMDLLVCIPLYGKSRREVDAWDGEDEALSDRIERRLSLVMWISSVVLICAMFLMAAVYAGGLSIQTIPGLIVTIVAFIAAMAVTIITQQKLVDLCKRLNPEKYGSVYDLRFQKKWMNSCDEAEKILIGQCAYKAYTAVGKACLVLWLVFTIAALFLDIGFLPVLVVCIIWAVSQSVYCYWAIKLQGHGIGSL